MSWQGENSCCWSLINLTLISLPNSVTCCPFFPSVVYEYVCDPKQVDNAECFVINKKKKQKNKNAEQMPPKAPFVKGPKGPPLPQAPKKPAQKVSMQDHMHAGLY